ncbi:acyl carrier protein [Nocardia wallacei]|uniref:acyl carrier protein n=1 Tax=Nocardia wallacei TaxID=480035 RepID=UPI002458DC76|nr:acyl carrier protein [Nocardia wallacei]
MPDIRTRLTGRAPDDQVRILVQLVCDHATVVLAHDSGEDIEPRRPLFELGSDSLTAVELCNRLETVTGLRLPLATIFQYRTATELAHHLHSEIMGTRLEAAADRDTPP